MTIEANISLRILTPRQVLEGSGNPNALENINPSQLPDGCLCWVISEAALYRYEAEGIESRAYPDIIPTCYGEGTKGRWRRTIQDAAPSTSVNCCATADVNLLAPVATFDTHVLVDNDRVLLPFQTDQTENGIYSWDAISGLLTRAADFDAGEEFVPGLIVSVTQGDQYLGADFRLVNTGAIVLGVTDILFGLSSGILLVDRFGVTIARHDQLQVFGAFLSSVGQANVIDLRRVDVGEFGASPTETPANNTIAVQNAVNSLQSASPTAVGGGILFIPRGITISGTIVFNRLAVLLQGEGWEEEPGLAWDGPAGIPMLQFTDCYGVLVHDLWIRGNTTNVPSAGINLYRTALHTVGTNGQFLFDHVLIGPPKWDALGPNPDFSAGILVDGTNGNNDEIHIRSSVVRLSVRGLDQPNSQSIWDHLQDVLFDQCSETGIRTFANLHGTNLTFNRCGCDITTGGTARVNINGWQSENTVKVAYLGESSFLSVDGGVIRLDLVTGAMIDGDPIVRYTANSSQYIQSLSLRNMQFNGGAGTALITMKPLAGVDVGELIPWVEIRNVRGLNLPTQLDIDPVDALDARRLIVDSAGYIYDKVLRFPDTVDLNPPAPQPAIPDSADPTTNLILGVMRNAEMIEWPAVPNSPTLGGNEGWWSAATQGVLAGTPVASETDYSGNARDSVQGVVASQPIARGVGAASYMEFDGIDDVTVAGVAADWTFFQEAEWMLGAVLRVPVADPDDIYALFSTWDGQVGTEGTSIEFDDRSGVGASNQIRVRTRTGVDTTTVTSAANSFSTNTWHKLIVWRHNNVITIQIDDTVAVSEAVAPPTLGGVPAGALRTGALLGGTAFGRIDVADRAIWSQTFSRHGLAAINYNLDDVLAGL